MNSIAPLTEELKPVRARNRFEAMIGLNNRLPLNDLGMPTVLYRPDAIPHLLEEMEPAVQAKTLNDAAIHLNYSEGFPTTPSGKLLWDQLDFEGSNEFVLFQAFLEMNNVNGYRSTQILARTLTDQKYNALAPARKSAAAHKEMLDLTRQHVQELAVYFYWGHRARAYDMVGMAAYRRIRSQRAVLLEDASFHALQRMFKKTMDRWDRFTDDDMDQMSPLDVTKMMKEIVQMQRISVGLPGSAPLDSHLPGNQNGSDQGIEVHLRTIAKQQQVASDGTSTSALLDSEQDTAVAQELVIKMMQKANARK